MDLGAKWTNRNEKRALHRSRVARAGGAGRAESGGGRRKVAEGGGGRRPPASVPGAPPSWVSVRRASVPVQCPRGRAYSFAPRERPGPAHSLSPPAPFCHALSCALEGERLRCTAPPRTRPHLTPSCREIGLFYETFSLHIVVLLRFIKAHVLPIRTEKVASFVLILFLMPDK